MTPCEKLGYKVGDEFVVVETETTFDCGSKVRLIDDDGTSSPKFEGVGCKANDGGDWHFMHLGRVKPSCEEGITTPSPITTLKQARATRDEAEQAYQQALAEAREYLGEGFMLTEVGSDGPLVDGEDMTDPANWREGDVLTCIDNGGHGWYTDGKQYAIVRIDEDDWPVMQDDDGDQSALAPSRMRFHHRPN